jgi:hypothetical protein
MSAQLCADIQTAGISPVARQTLHRKSRSRSPPVPKVDEGSGYTWVAVDNVLVFMSYFGVGGDLIIPMRWGIQLAALTWISGASWVATGATTGIMNPAV